MGAQATSPPPADDAILRRHRHLAEDRSLEKNPLHADFVRLFSAYEKLFRRLDRIITISDTYQSQVKTLVRNLQRGASGLTDSSALVPMCAGCKKVRRGDGGWEQVERYIVGHSESRLTHSICPDCVRRLYGKTAVKKPPARALRLDTGKLDLDDAVVREFLPVLTGGDLSRNPLYPDLLSLFQKYVRLSGRMNRVIKISDSYQDQLRQLKDSFELLSQVDQLTGLANRRALIERLDAERSRAQRRGTSFSVIMADIDDLKKINDTHGHIHGDEVIVKAANILRAILRKEDVCARWGGDEFLLLLQETPPEIAANVATRILDYARSTEIEARGATMRFTFSLGIAAYLPGESVDDLSRRADDALYRAKNSGKNRFALAKSE